MKTQKKAFISLFFCVFIIFWGFQVLAQDWTPEQKEIWSMQKKEWDLWKKGDMDAFKGLFHEDCVIWWSKYGNHWTKAGLENWPSWIESFDLQPSVVKVSGDVAIIRYISNFETVSYKSKSRFTNVWKKQNGKWQIVLEEAYECEKPTPCPK